MIYKPTKNSGEIIEAKECAMIKDNNTRQEINGRDEKKESISIRISSTECGSTSVKINTTEIEQTRDDTL